MDKNEVFAVICRQLQQNVHGVDVTRVDPQATLASYGATSLDIVEIVSGSMRELRVKLPRTELARLKKIDDLVELLHATKNAAAVSR